jgi:hypothetical protein
MHLLKPGHDKGQVQQVDRRTPSKETAADQEKDEESNVTWHPVIAKSELLNKGFPHACLGDLLLSIIQFCLTGTLM